ncbi:tyrosine-protein phosphatase non-receptor type 4-like isoform X2 [Montipora capricornis]|uniref:tyrosine-protein phosphatase non-receptor type 4-like isoform X2 n=1 Tax=Montipora capricornis TaxID=246305 RepID=UPI0035F13E53
MSRKFRPTSLGSQSGIYSVRGSELARTGKTTPNQIRCVVELLDDSEFVIDIDKQSKGAVLLEAVFKHLDLVEKHFFGLQFVADSPDNLQWLNSEKQIRKQLKRGPPYIFYFRVRFFASDPSKLSEDITRYQFYLQIKRDLLTGRLPCLYDTAAELASYVLQGELGDYDPRVMVDTYVSEFRFVPDQTADFEERAAEFHKHHCGQSPADAEFNFLEVAKNLDLYGVDLHFAKDHDGLDLHIGISHIGLTVYHNRCKINFFPWSKIVKVCFKRKRFFVQIRPDWNEWTDNVIGFHMPTYRACKTLWKTCVEYHTFYRTHFPKPSINRKNSLVRIGSKYRYRGKTEYQALEEGRQQPRTEPKIVRTLSRRYSKRNDDGSRRRIDLDNVFNKDDSVLNERGPQSAGLNYSSSVPSDFDKINHSLVRSKSLGIGDEVRMNRLKPTLTPELQRNGSVHQEGIITVRMEPDELGRFGFNVQGGADINLPVIVSKIARGMPADMCMPQLQEGDEIVHINGRTVKDLPHREIVDLIRTISKSNRRLLIMTIRPNVFTHTPREESPVHVVSPDQYIVAEQKYEQERENAKQEKDKALARDTEALRVSMDQLRENLESGDLLVYFQELYRKKPGMPMEVARKPENLPRNRYRDILPYDDTRVKLIQGKNNYVNANYVTMEIPARGVKNRYIAAQGPLEKTCGDFWQMVWEQEASLIVMLTTTVERGRVKCHQYWPEGDETLTFGSLEIICTKIRDFSPSYIYREMFVTDSKSLRSRVVVQLQYIAWPDHDVPDDSSDFLEFIHIVRHYREGTNTPSVLHCSAGVGRTGVLIFMETAFNMIEGAEPIFPLEIVRRMRDQRCSLIQTPGQFIFVLEALLRAFDEEMVKPL